MIVSGSVQGNVLDWPPSRIDARSCPENVGVNGSWRVEVARLRSDISDFDRDAAGKQALDIQIPLLHVAHAPLGIGGVDLAVDVQIRCLIGVVHADAYIAGRIQFVDVGVIGRIGSQGWDKHVHHVDVVENAIPCPDYGARTAEGPPRQTEAWSKVLLAGIIERPALADFGKQDLAGEIEVSRLSPDIFNRR